MNNDWNDLCDKLNKLNISYINYDLLQKTLNDDFDILANSYIENRYPDIILNSEISPYKKLTIDDIKNMINTLKNHIWSTNTFIEKIIVKTNNHNIDYKFVNSLLNQYWNYLNEIADNCFI